MARSVVARDLSSPDALACPRRRRSSWWWPSCWPTFAFLGLGSVFDYPDILQEDADEILAAFRDDEGTIIALFVILALSAALLAPIAILLGRLAGERAWTVVDLGGDRRCGSPGDRPEPLGADRALSRRS